MLRVTHSVGLFTVRRKNARITPQYWEVLVPNVDTRAIYEDLGCEEFMIIAPYR